jgi:multiple sugar transport system ATP-binding protein
MNIIEGELSEAGGGLSVIGRGFSLPVSESTSHRWSAAKPARQIAFGIRPERVVVAPNPTNEAPIASEIQWVEHLGNRTIVTLRVGDTVLKAVVPPGHPFGAGRNAWIGLRPDPHHLLNRETGVFYQVGF